MKRYKRKFEDQSTDKESIMEYTSKMYEMVLHPNNYVNLMKDKLNLFYNKNDFMDLKDLIISLNSYFLNEKIEFKKSPLVEPFGNGLLKGGYQPKTGTIYLFYDNNIIDSFKLQNNKNLNTDFKWFLETFEELLGHEVVHRLQFLKDNIKKIGVMSDKNEKEYLAQPKEVMAYAWQIVQTFKMYKYDNEFIRFILKDREDTESLKNINYIPMFKKYYNYFPKNSNVIKLLYKYIYLYTE